MKEWKDREKSIKSKYINATDIIVLTVGTEQNRTYAR